MPRFSGDVTDSSISSRQKNQQQTVAVAAAPRAVSAAVARHGTAPGSHDQRSR
ncbi:hypothetical protein J6590_036951 [Homalodisca vitripennis]|nr:hypothetical protein J6590_036951 [Homalodisca vitripennis]